MLEQYTKVMAYKSDIKMNNRLIDGRREGVEEEESCDECLVCVCVCKKEKSQSLACE